MSVGGISVVVVAALALTVTAVLTLLRRNRIRHRQWIAAEAVRAQPSQRFRRPDSSAGLPAVTHTIGTDEQTTGPANLSLVGTDELAESMRAYQSHRKRWRAARTLRTKRPADRGTWAAGASFGLGAGWGGADGSGGYDHGVNGSGCGGGGCGGGGCGGGGS